MWKSEINMNVLPSSIISLMQVCYLDLCDWPTVFWLCEVRHVGLLTLFQGQTHSLAENVLKMQLFSCRQDRLSSYPAVKNMVPGAVFWWQSRLPSSWGLTLVLATCCNSNCSLRIEGPYSWRQDRRRVAFLLTWIWPLAPAVRTRKCICILMYW